MLGKKVFSSVFAGFFQTKNNAVNNRAKSRRHSVNVLAAKQDRSEGKLSTPFYSFLPPTPIRLPMIVE